MRKIACARSTPIAASKYKPITPSTSPAAHIQAVGRALRLKPMSLQDIYDRLLEYLKAGRVMEWRRVKGDVKMVALAMMENREACLIRVDGRDYLRFRRPNRIIQFLSLGSRK